MNEPPVILFDPHPRKIDLIFSDADRQRLEALATVLWHEGGPAEDAHIDEHLPNAIALIGQTALSKARLDRAPHLKVICNVEGNFLPNLDYDECYRRHIPVLSCSPAFAPAVAELALGLALASARDIVGNDAAFRQGTEKFGATTTVGCHLLRGRTIGLLGCGNVGRNLLPLLRPFGGRLVVHDPWLHDHTLETLGVEPMGLEDVLRSAQVVFVISAASTENQRGLGAEHFAMMQPGTIVVLVGRSEVVDFDALLDAAESGHIRAAIDVFPEEPLPANHRVRTTPNTILSAHRAGGIPETFHEVGRMVVDEIELVLRGLPPQRMQRALPETVGQYRGKPVEE